MDSLIQAQERAMDAAWGDGLPVVPPTADLIASFSEHLRGDMDTELVPETSRHRSIANTDLVWATILAGCRPEHLPVVKAGMQALFENDAVILGSGDWFVTLIVNGPSRTKLGFNSGIGVFGPGFRPNNTVGRAVALAGRAALKQPRRSPLGDPAHIGVCLAEDEQGSTWAPLHQLRGFQHEQDVVTVFPARYYTGETDRRSGTAEEVLDWLVAYLRGRGSGADDPSLDRHFLMLLICPDLQVHFRGSGMSKEAAGQYLYDRLVDPSRPGSRLRLEDPADLSLVSCGGSGVGWNWVLTAGHPPTSVSIERQ
jgi:hypothetical protein